METANYASLCSTKKSLLKFTYIKQILNKKVLIYFFGLFQINMYIYLANFANICKIEKSVKKSEYNTLLVSGYVSIHIYTNIFLQQELDIFSIQMYDIHCSVHIHVTHLCNKNHWYSYV